MLTPAVTTVPISPVCPTCGIIQKSGKLSCCARGGSWFANCGNAGNTNFGHTWYEGIRSCKARQFQVAVGQQLHTSLTQSNAFSDNANISVHAKEAIVADHVVAFTSANASTPMPGATPIAVSATTLTITIVRKPMAYNAGNKTINSTISAMVHIPANVIPPESTISPAIGVSMKPMVHSASASVPMANLSHESGSRSITAREYEKFSRVVTYLNIILVIACC